jgi:hypothetical protein
MKNNQRRLNAILKIFSIDELRSASFGKYDCSLWADFSGPMLKKALSHKFVIDSRENPHAFVLSRGRIQLFLMYPVK